MAIIISRPAILGGMRFASRPGDRRWVNGVAFATVAVMLGGVPLAHFNPSDADWGPLLTVQASQQVTGAVSTVPYCAFPGNYQYFIEYLL